MKYTKARRVSRIYCEAVPTILKIDHVLPGRYICSVLISDGTQQSLSDHIKQSILFELQISDAMHISTLSRSWESVGVSFPAIYSTKMINGRKLEKGDRIRGPSKIEFADICVLYDTLDDKVVLGSARYHYDSVTVVPDFLESRFAVCSK